MTKCGVDLIYFLLLFFVNFYVSAIPLLESSVCLIWPLLSTICATSGNKSYGNTILFDAASESVILIRIFERLWRTAFCAVSEYLLPPMSRLSFFLLTVRVEYFGY